MFFSDSLLFKFWFQSFANFIKAQGSVPSSKILTLQKIGLIFSLNVW